MRNHNLRYGAKIRKMITPSKPHFHYIKVGYMRVFTAWTCLHDEIKEYGILEFGMDLTK